MMRDVWELFEGTEDQGWNEETMLTHLVGFINREGLHEKCQQYLKDVAAEENEECKEAN